MSVQRPVGHRLVDASDAGVWRIFARPRRGRPIELTDFRGELTQVGDYTFEDPGGPKDMTVIFPAVSAYERRGAGDLYWMNRHTSFDVVFDGELPAAYPIGRTTGSGWMPGFAWEGFFDGKTVSHPGGTSLKLAGATYQLDKYEAKPEYLMRPLPYELAMARQLQDKPHLRIGRMLTEWPAGWGKTYTPPPKGTPHYLVPLGLHRGDNWTGLVTRDTGSWEPVFSSYIVKLLQQMYTRHGRWTWDLLRGRVPVLTHRTMLTRPNAHTVILDLADPGVVPTSLEEDWGSAVDIAYGQGTALTGVAFSGMQVTSDGSRTYYDPMAALRQVFPVEANDWLDLSHMPTEVNLSFPPGLDEYQAQQVARAHIERFGDPGVTGELVLDSDPLLGSGDRIPRAVVRGGMAAQLRGYHGMPEGVMVHIASSTHSLATGKTTVQIDSKWRDALTVAEVRLKGRDRMNIARMLVAGQYTPPIPDQLLPWNYAEGSGVIPYTPDAVELFDRMPDRLRFPWTDATTVHPPRKARWRDAYIHIPPAQHSPDADWSGVPHVSGGRRFAVPIRMAQAGQIRLIQIGAYDEDGNVLAVPFHISFYYAKNTSVTAMPKIRQVDADDSTQPFTDDQVGEHSPWVKDAWEQYNSDGTLKSTNVPAPLESAGLWLAYGNLQVKAGYFPADGLGGGDPVTGLLADETIRPFDTTHYGQFDPYSRKSNKRNTDAGMVYAMVYCDAQGTDDVYFLGRMFRVEPGSNPGGG